MTQLNRWEPHGGSAAVSLPLSLTHQGIITTHVLRSCHILNRYHQGDLSAVTYHANFVSPFTASLSQ